MERTEFTGAEQYTKRNTFRRIWRQFVRVMACIVVFCTTYALILPAITLIKSTTCGLETHTHTESCYVKRTTGSVTELTCTYDTIGVHIHTDGCYDGDGALVCGQADFVVHRHDSACLAEDSTLVCTLPEIHAHTHSEGCYEFVATETAQSVHSHTEACYTLTRSELVCQLTEGEGHAHAEACYGQGNVCGLEESDTHTHDESCLGSVLTCGREEGALHWHADGCYTLNLETTCGLEEGETVTEVLTSETKLVCTAPVIVLHTHGDGCYEGEALICAETVVTEHVHGDACFTTTETPLANVDTLTCGQEETAGHTHDDTCLDENGEYACGQEEAQAHTHTALCYGAWELVCELEEHVHTEECAPGLTGEQQAAVDAVIEAIEALPSADEIDAKIEEFEAAEDLEGEEAWLTEVYAQVREAYNRYAALDEELRGFVTNEDKLLELEYIWSAEVLAQVNQFWSQPTQITQDVAHTSDFIELNLYDYLGPENGSSLGGINTKHAANAAWPGFQWNGGAYMASDTFHRHEIDYIDFGNSLITDFTYGSSDTTNGVSKNKIAVVNKGGSVNKIWGVTNHPIGMSRVTDILTTSVANLDVIKPVLSNSRKGYPVLMDSEEVAGVDGVLDWLFLENTDGNSDYVKKMNTASVDGLFQIDPVTGEYFFNSRENHAQFNAATNSFSLYEEVITPNFITYPFGNFLPFNSITDNTAATEIGLVKNVNQYLGGETLSRLNAKEQNGGLTTSEKQLRDMLNKYKADLNALDVYYKDGTYRGKAWEQWSGLEAIQDYFWGDGGSSDNTPSPNTQGIIDRVNLGMYNIDFDEKTNFFFSMEMVMNLMMPNDGMAGNDNNKDGIPDYPMKFNFSGDDDVWVYIDGILFLDLSGIHRHVGGEIDFKNGMVHYYELLPSETGDVSTTPYKSYTFTQLVTKAIRFQNRTKLANGSMSDADITEIVNSIIDPATGTLYEYKTYQFKFFYTERGSGSSVCRMNFNFPILRKNTISVTKEVVPIPDVPTLGDPDYYFNILIKENNKHSLLVGPNSKTGITTYTILDENDNVIGTGKTDAYGIFTLKAGQTALFEGISEDSGQFYVQELIKNDDNSLYGGLIQINGSTPHPSGIIDWSTRDWFPEDGDGDPQTGPYGFIWQFYSSSYTEANSSTSHFFEVRNGMDASKLGELFITKQLVGPDGLPKDSDEQFEIFVSLDEIPLQVGWTYTVTKNGIESTRTVTNEGYITLAPGETAKLTGIISGSVFMVKEHADSAEGYKVTYDIQQVGTKPKTYYYKNEGTHFTGPLFVGTSANIIVTNSENGASLSIPVKKAFTNFDEEPREYTFLLQEANADGTVKTGGTSSTQTFDVTAEDQTFQFPELTYLKHNFASFPEPATVYYRITESGETSNSLDNTQAYLVEVTISEVEVTVSEEEDSAKTVKPITAAVTKVWLGTVNDAGTISGLTELPTGSDDIVFTNTLIGGLTVSKEVLGGTTYHDGLDFTFTLELTAGTSGVDVPTQILKDGAALDAVDGKFIFRLKNGDSVTLTGIPIGAEWTLTEATEGQDSYITDSTQDGGTTYTEGTVSWGTVTTATAAVHYRNNVQYALPETGGAGTIPYTMAGLVLMVLSAAYLLYRPKARRREGE